MELYTRFMWEVKTVFLWGSIFTKYFFLVFLLGYRILFDKKNTECMSAVTCPLHFVHMTPKEMCVCVFVCIIALSDVALFLYVNVICNDMRLI